LRPNTIINEKTLVTQLEKKEAIEEDNPLSVFLFALKAPETKRQYPRRAKVFLDFLKLEEPFSKSGQEISVWPSCGLNHIHGLGDTW
jgi:hypothetical protein